MNRELTNNYCFKINIRGHLVLMVEYKNCYCATSDVPESVQNHAHWGYATVSDILQLMRAGVLN